MKTSPETDKIIGAIFALQGELEPMPRDAEAKEGSKVLYRYSSLEAITSALKPLLQKHQLLVMQPIDQGVLITRVTHLSGQWVESETQLSGAVFGQDFGADVTFKRRYAECSLLGIVSEEDTDAGLRHSPTKGILQWLTPARQARITNLAEYIKDQYSSGDMAEMLKARRQITDSEEITALWSLLPAKPRKVIKEMEAAEREAGGAPGAPGAPPASPAKRPRKAAAGPAATGDA